MSLLPQHQLLISQSAISPAVAEARGYRSVSDRHELLQLGFKSNQARPGLLIPRWDVLGQNGRYQLRPDEPRRVGDRVLKYETPAGDTMSLDVPPSARAWLADPGRPLLITEGIRKADAAVSAGLACIAVLGVWAWRGKNALGGKTALADWEQVALNGRTVYVAFDSDVMLNPKVREALERLSAFLTRRGAMVRPIYLPHRPGGAKVGLDDYLAGHTVSELLSFARDRLLDPPPADEKGFRTTDVGNAERLVAQHGLNLRYGADVGWLVYDEREGRWLRDPDGTQVQRYAQLTARGIYAEAAAEPEPDRRAQLARWAAESERSPRIAAMMQQTRSATRIAVKATDLDRDPYLVNVLNGIVDLRNGLLLPHRREDLMSRLAPVHYDPHADCPTWRTFLTRILAGDTALIDFVQRAIGYALTGLTDEQVIFMLYGTGANGKSTFIETLRSLLGDYSAQTSFDTFLVRDRDSARNDLARLAGVRLVSASEVEAGKRLSEVTIKQLTGGDRVTARFLFREYFEFTPVFKLFLSMNHRPRVYGTDEGIWRRIHLVPFIVTIPPGERDKRLPDRLRAELPGILAWAVQGCLEWQRRGLDAPDAVQTATQTYREEQDALAGFLGERCVVHERAKASAADLYAAYKGFAEANGDEVLKQKWFGTRLGERGFEQRRDSATGRVWWHGVGLRAGDARASEGRPDMHPEPSEPSEPCFGVALTRDVRRTPDLGSDGSDGSAGPLTGILAGLRAEAFALAERVGFEAMCPTTTTQAGPGAAAWRTWLSTANEGLVKTVIALLDLRLRGGGVA